MVKNNVTRMLESRGISFQAFELPPEKLSAQEAANFLGVDPDLVYKTIVATRVTTGKPLLALVSALQEVDLKSLASALEEKKVQLASHKQAEQLTGLQTGGISPLALLQRNFQVVLDETAKAQDEIYISGGQRGINIRLPTKELVRLTKAKFAPISRFEVR